MKDSNLLIKHSLPLLKASKENILNIRYKKVSTLLGRTSIWEELNYGGMELTYRSIADLTKDSVRMNDVLTLSLKVCKLKLQGD